MKKVAIAVLFVFAALAGTAQTKTAEKTPLKAKGPANPPEQRAQKSVDQLDRVATLTAEQKPKVYDLALTRAKKIDEIHAKYKDQKDKAGKAQEIQLARIEYRKGVKAILTPEQLAKVKAKMKENKGAKGKSDDDLIPDGEGK